MTAAQRLTRGLLLSLTLLLPAAQAQTSLSPAQQVFNRVNRLLEREYGGLSTVDRAALRDEYQERLNAVCDTQADTCSEEKAYPVIQAEMTALGDDHSFFQTPEDYQDFMTDATGGNRQQFGVKLARLDGENRVIMEVIPGSAAAEAGLQRGDLITTLNGKPYHYTALRQASQNGQPITLGITRQNNTLTVTLQARESSSRDLPRLTYQAAPDQTGQVAVLRIPTFLSGGGVAQQVHDLVGQAQQQPGVRGMVVDLRSNTGGNLTECDNAVSAFLPSLTRVARNASSSTRTVVSRGTRLDDGQLTAAVHQPHLWTGPLAVLVDEVSASCSELFAYEIQYAARGPILGEPTAGVGNTVTRLFPAGQGALQLTILNYVKSDGQPYPTRITPDHQYLQGEEEIRQLTHGVDTLLQHGLDALLSAPTLSADQPDNNN